LWKSPCGSTRTTVFAGTGLRVYRLLTVSSLWDKGTSVSSAFGIPTHFWRKYVGWKTTNRLW